MKAVLLALLATAAPALAQESEDAAHRADRLETQQLNTRSWNGYSSGRHHPAGTGASDGQRAYSQALADYQQRLDAWRQRVAACEAGDYDACQ